MMGMSVSMRDKRFERGLYLLAALTTTLVVAAGFARTFYLRPWFQVIPLPNLLVVHGVLMTLWLLLFLTQVSLAAAQRTGLHRRLGWLGAILLPLIMVAGAATALSVGREHGRLSVMPSFDFVLFTFFVTCALMQRRRVDYHKRLMLLATLVMLLPAIVRLPLAFIEQSSLPAFMAMGVAVMLAFVVIDTVWHRRLHPAFAWGAALFTASMPLRLWVKGTELWQQFSVWIVS
jgi:hypothetical protein